jgi:hypothetical protein
MYYYSTDGTTFKSKIDAIAYKQKTNQEIFFYYHDDVYSKIDWHIEPPESLEYYYKQQAQRIRDNYDYVILAYSGGYDSTTILETFHFNNIKIDKIITVGALKKDSAYGVDENHNGELYHNVFPYIKELGLESIFQICDYSDIIDDPMNLSIGQYGENWIDYVGTWFSPHHWYWRDIEKYVVPEEYKNKKVAIVMGRDKPYLFHGNDDSGQPMMGGRFAINGFKFTDASAYSYGELGKPDYCDRINFYWDPTYPEVLLKQLHELNKVYLIHKYFGYDKDVGATVGDKSVHDIVYKLRKPLAFKSGKSNNKTVSLRDQYMLADKESKLYKFHAAGIENMKRRCGYEIDDTTFSRFYEVYNGRRK